MAIGARQVSGGPEQIDALVAVLDLVRDGAACTRSELCRQTGYGRTVISQRIAQLVDSGLLAEGGLGPSTGGRAPRELQFCRDAGLVLVAELGATSIAVGLADLAGNLLDTAEEPADISLGPELLLSRVEELFDALLRGVPEGSPPVWGVGLGVPGPIEFATGRPVAPPIMPGWDRYPIRERLTARYGAPTWVDNEVNLMALGELRAGLARGTADFVFVKIGTGIGAGLVSAGRLHRGAQGAAGDVGHVAVSDDRSTICRCGNVGCLEALAGGAALARDGTAAARSGRSPYLNRLLRERAGVDARDVAEAAMHGDSVAVELLARAGQLVGAMLATLVNFYNPGLIVVGGGVTQAGDLVLAAIRQAVYQRSLPLATRELQIVRSQLGDKAGLYGAAYLVIDEIFSRQHLPQWLEWGTPIGNLALQSA